MPPRCCTPGIGPLVTVTQVAHILGVSKMTVYRLVHDGTLPAMRIDNSYRVPAAALRDYLNPSKAATA